MKIVFKISTLLIAGTLLFQSCSKISEPYYTEKGVIVDTNKRAVLIEDYTGHLCVNCAPAGKTANTIQELYLGQAFVIAVHAGDFAKPNPANPYLSADYRSATGNDWNGYGPFNIDAYPKGMVNRRTYNGTLSFGVSDWNQAVQKVVTLPKVAIMTVHNTFNSTSKVMNSKIDVKFLQSYTGKVSLTVCILEDSIYGGQLNVVKPDSTPIIKHFRFMHMLRGSLNGSFGEEIASSPGANALVSKSYTFDFSPTDWVPAHCSVIAFISDAATYEVLHVVKSTDLKP